MLLSLSGLLLVSLISADPVVKTRSGSIRGVYQNTTQQKPYAAFKGIRYAQAPIKQLRFKAPVPVKGWTGVINATEDGDVCPQLDMSENKIAGDEDCLFLNVYTQKTSGKRPVMVYVHGGSFINGGCPSYYCKPEYLLEQNVVMVAVQYRLGPFGFLSTGDESAKGNWALLDVLLALTWIKDNIDSFGGDPQKITLFGEDSGAAIISYLMLTKKSKGLFNSMITLSGNALCDQFLQRQPTEVAETLADKLDCSRNNTTEDLVHCLRQKTVNDIVTTSNKLFKFYSFPRLWAPVIDGDLIKDDPETLMSAGKFHKVPVIAGQTSNEGAFYYRLTLNTFNNGYYDNKFIDDKIPKILPVITNFQRRLYPITRAVKKTYFDIKLYVEDEFRPKYVDFLTDILFTRCTDKFTSLLSNHSVPTYAYVFGYQGQHSLTKLQGETQKLGVAHGDELQYLFNDIWGSDLTMSAPDVHFGRHVFTPLLANFAKTNIPTPHLTEDITLAWTPYNWKKKNYFYIDKILSSKSFDEDKMRLWNQDIPNMFAKDMKEIKEMEKQAKMEEKEKKAQLKKQKKAATSSKASDSKEEL